MPSQIRVGDAVAERACEDGPDRDGETEEDDERRERDGEAAAAASLRAMDVRSASPARSTARCAGSHAASQSARPDRTPGRAFARSNSSEVARVGWGGDEKLPFRRLAMFDKRGS